MTPNETPTPITDAITNLFTSFAEGAMTPHVAAVELAASLRKLSALERRNAELVAALERLAAFVEWGLSPVERQDALAQAKDAIRNHKALAAQEGGEG